MIKKSFLIGLSFAASIALTGCGGGGGSSSSTDTNTDTGDTGSTPQTITISGKSVDGYLVNSLVCLDLDKNSVCDTNEPSAYTNTTGEYSFDITTTHQEHANYVNGTASLIVTGGYDADTKEDFQGILRVPFDKEEGIVNISPLTNIVMALLEESGYNEVTSSDIQSIIVQVASALGVSEDTIMADPIELSKNGSSDALKAALQIQKTMELISESTAGDDTKEKIANAYSSFVTSLKDADTSTNTTIVEKISTILDGTNFSDDEKEAAKLLAQNINSAMEDTSIDLSNEEDITKVAIQIETTKDNFQEELENDSPDFTGWESKYTENVISDVDVEVLEDLLSLIGFIPLEIDGLSTTISEIIAYSGFNANIQLSELKELLETNQPIGYEDIVSKIDEKLAQLSGESTSEEISTESSYASMMSDYTTSYYANLSTGENVTDDSWHFSYLKGVGFKTNKDAGISVCIAKTYSELYSDGSPEESEFEKLTLTNTQTDFDAVSLSDCQADDYITDTVESQFKNWYTYDSSTHVVTVNTDSSNGWIVRSSDGNSYARLTATAYSSGVTFDVENWDGSTFTTAVSTGSLDYSSGEIFYNIEDNTSSTTEFDGWDIKIEKNGYGHNIYVNGGESGDGEAGIGYVMLDSASNVTDPTDSSQIYKYYGDSATGAMSQPGDYGALEMLGYQMWPTFAVYIFKDGDKYYKAQVVSNYGLDGAQASGNHVIRYAELIPSGDSTSDDSSSDDSTDSEGSDNSGDTSSAGATSTFAMNATDSSTAAFADLGIGATVTDDSWQIAYQKYVGFKSNSEKGISICVAKTYANLYSGSTPVQSEFESLTASNTLTDFEDVNLSNCEASDYITDSVESQFTNWHTSGYSAEIETDPTKNGWIIRTADGNSYARVKASTMADGELTFSVELWNGTSFDEAITTPPLAYYMEDTYYDIETNSASAIEFDGWDLKFTNVNHYPGIFVNGGASGDGEVGVGALQVATVDDVTDPTDTTQVYKYFGDTASGALSTPGTYGPFEYSVASMHQMWPTFTVYIVKDGDKYYKMQVLGNYGSDGSLQSGNLVIRYAEFE